MIPFELLRESSVVQWMVEEVLKEEREKEHAEGEQQGRRKELLRLLARGIAKRFPGLELSAEAEQARDLDALEDLLLNLGEVPDAATLRARLQAAGSAPRNGQTEQLK